MIEDQRKRFNQRMTEAGFSLIYTGGNCTAFANENESILITRRTYPEAPEVLSEPITVEFYSSTGEFLHSKNFKSLSSFLDNQYNPFTITEGATKQ